AGGGTAALPTGHARARGVAKFPRPRWPSAATAADGEPQAAAPEPGDGAQLAGAQQAGEPDRGASAPHGDGVIDESAVAEFARELSGSLGPDAAVNPAADATADAEAGVPA